MAEIWFSSDPHFHHKNIIDFCHRPFSDVKEMNEKLVEWHNQYVKPQDHWYCLGDVTMERDNEGLGLRILHQMNGHKRLIMGNHDHYPIAHYFVYFEKIMAMNQIDGIEFSHVPFHPSSMGSCKANVHGHIHNQKSPAPYMYPKSNGTLDIRPYINISMEVIGYRPRTLGEIKEMIAESKEEYREAWEK